MEKTHAESKNIPPAFIFKDKHLNKLKKINKNTPQFKKIIMSILGDNMLTKNLYQNFYDILDCFFFFLY